MTERGEPPAGIAPLGPNPPEVDLRGHLGAALAAAGYGQLCLPADRPPPNSVGAGWTGALITLMIALSTALAIREGVQLALGRTLILGVVLFFGVLWVGQRERNIVPMFVFWLIGGGTLWWLRGFGSFFQAYGAAIALTLLIYGVIKARKNRIGVDMRALLRSVPFLFPLVLLLLFVPLVTEDLWRVAAEMGFLRLGLLALLTVLPLTIVLGRKLVSTLPAVIGETSGAITDKPESVGQVHLLVERLLGPYPGSWVLNHGRTLILRGYNPKMALDYSPYLTEIVRRPLSRALAIRTGIMLLGLGVVVFVYLYLLAAIVVDANVAQEWSRHPVPETTMEVRGLSIPLPGGPYVAIAALLGIVALGAFLALLMVEESYSKAIAGALIYEPVNEYLLLALPYVHLREREILGEAPTAQEGPLASPSGLGD